MDLSVIIPVYNGEKCLEKAVVNLLQLNRDLDFEIIIINDGSHDNSNEIGERLAKKYVNVSYYFEQNAGVAAARNKGLFYAKGRYVTFVDQDDALNCGYKKYVQMLENNESDVLIANYYVQDNKERKLLCYFDKTCVIEDAYIREVVQKLVCGEFEGVNYNYINYEELPTSVWNCMFRREIITTNEIQFKRFVDYEDDWIFLIEILLESKRVTVCKDAFYCWMIYENSESHKGKYIENLYEKRQNIIKWTRNILIKLKVKDEVIFDFVSNYQRKRTILWCFYNECWKIPFVYNDYVENMQMVLDSEKKIKDKSLKLGEKIYLILLQGRFLRVAYIINRYIVRKHFH